MAASAASISQHQVAQNVGRWRDGMSVQNLASLNPAHLKALLGQEVVITLADGATRTGVVYVVDPESFTVALLKAPAQPGTHPVDAGSDSVCVVPGHAVKAVEIVGGNQLALDALKGGLQGWQIKMGGRQHQQDVFRGFGGFSLTDAMNATKSGVSAAAAASDTSALSASTHAAQQQRARPRFNVEEAERRRLRVKAALEANRIPFEEHIAEPAPMLYVMGTLRLPWPYTAEACQCPNEIVLTRVQALLSSS